MNDKFIKIWQWIKQIIHKVEHAYPKLVAKISKIWVGIKGAISIVAFLRNLSWVAKWFLWFLVVLLGCS